LGESKKLAKWESFQNVNFENRNRDHKENSSWERTNNELRCCPEFDSRPASHWPCL